MRPLLTALVPLFLIGLAAPAAGQGGDQATVRGKATIEIGEIMTLEVRPGGGLAARSADGVYRELDGALRLRIRSNRPWQLLMVAGSGGSRVASLEAGGEPRRALWWRVDSDRAPGVPGDYREAVDGPVVVTGGGKGRTELEIDYRWFDGPGREMEPGTVVHFTLAPR